MGFNLDQMRYARIIPVGDWQSKHWTTPEAFQLEGGIWRQTHRRRGRGNHPGQEVS
jgi:hypothetical protein